MTTTITTRQIRQLRTEARAAGDGIQVQLCTVALATGLGEVAEIDEDFRSDLEALGVIPEHVGADVRARVICAQAIADAGGAVVSADRVIAETARWLASRQLERDVETPERALRTVIIDSDVATSTMALRVLDRVDHQSAIRAHGMWLRTRYSGALTDAEIEPLLARVLAEARS